MNNDLRRAITWLKASHSLGTPRVSGVLFLVLLASGVLGFLWSLAASSYFGVATQSPRFEPVWFVIALTSILVSAAGATVILATIRSWIFIPLAWAALAALLFVATQYGFSQLLVAEGQRAMAERSINLSVSLSVFAGAFIPIFLIAAGTRFLGGRSWVFLLGGVVGSAMVQIPVLSHLLSAGMQRWDLILSPLVNGFLLGGGLYLGLLATVRPPESERESAAGTQVSSDTPSDVVLKMDWVKAGCWVVIGLFAIMKVIFLARGQSLASWLDVSNPSITGLVATGCIITLIVRGLRQNKNETHAR